MTQKSVTKNDNPRLPPSFIPIITKLTEIRKQLNVSQFDLECKIGIARGYLSKWERGQRTPTFFNLICWASALGLEIEFKPASPKSANDNGELIANDNGELINDKNLHSTLTKAQNDN
ncbi:MAG: hypothetical protein Roseis2KO_07160 [Roseivirga sp.]